MELANVTLEILGFLFVIGVLAGFLDTLAGGGGLLSIPALMIGGMPPLLALGTNKLQASVGIGAATLLLFRKKKFSWSEVKAGVLIAFIGSLIGAIIVQSINAETLSFVIPIVLGFIALYFIVSPGVKDNTKASMSKRSYQNIAVSIIGCYDGILGPGAGSFYVLTGVALKRLDLIQSAIQAKPLNLASNVASMVVFISFGQVAWLIGFLMMAGQVIGASIGAHYLVKANPKVIRALIVGMSCAMLIRYSYSMGWLS
jgi:hypothetical protein